MDGCGRPAPICLRPGLSPKQQPVRPSPERQLGTKSPGVHSLCISPSLSAHGTSEEILAPPNSSRGLDFTR